MKKRVNTYTSVNYFFLMQGTTVNKDIPINEASGVGYTVDIFRLHTTHLRVKIREYILFV